MQHAFELERLRGDFGIGTTPAPILIELHDLFQLLMSVISARIEGNRTTVYDAIRGIGGGDPRSPAASESQQEIQNILEAMEFIDGISDTDPLTHVFIRELHRISVQRLTREGDPTPGSTARLTWRSPGPTTSLHHTCTFIPKWQSYWTSPTVTSLHRSS